MASIISIAKEAWEELVIIAEANEAAGALIFALYVYCILFLGGACVTIFLLFISCVEEGTRTMRRNFFNGRLAARYRISKNANMKKHPFVMISAFVGSLFISGIAVKLDIRFLFSPYSWKEVLLLGLGVAISLVGLQAWLRSYSFCRFLVSTWLLAMAFVGLMVYGAMEQGSPSVQLAHYTVVSGFVAILLIYHSFQVDYMVAQTVSAIINSLTSAVLVIVNVIVFIVDALFPGNTFVLPETIQTTANLLLLPFIVIGYGTVAVNEVQYYHEQKHKDLLPHGNYISKMKSLSDYDVSGVERTEKIPEEKAQETHKAVGTSAQMLSTTRFYVCSEKANRKITITLKKEAKKES